MGCGHSMEEGDGAAYLGEEVAVFEVPDHDGGDGDGGKAEVGEEVTVFEVPDHDGGDGDGGKAEVAEKIAEIEASKVAFDHAIAAVFENGGVPAAGSELATIAAEEGCDVVGALFAIRKTLQGQHAELVARSGGGSSAELAALKKQIDDTNTQLVAAVQRFLEEWKLPPPADALAMADPAVFATLPIANAAPGKTTMQRVLGALVLQAEAKVKRPAASNGADGDESGLGGGGGGSAAAAAAGPGPAAAAAAAAALTLPNGEVRLAEWDHGEIATKEEAVRRVNEQAKDNFHHFLICSHPEGVVGTQFYGARPNSGALGAVGEFWLYASFDSDPLQFPITRDPTTQLLLVPKDPYKPFENVNSYDGAATLPELVAALGKDGRGDWNSSHHQLRHPVPSPEHQVGGTVENQAQLHRLLESYAAARTSISAPLVRAILSDVGAYDAAAAKHTALAGPAVMARLAAAAQTAASASMRFTPDKIAELTLAAPPPKKGEAPLPTALLFVAVAQRTAADVSIAVYSLVCVMIDAAGVGGYCIPGGVKGSRRIVFKTLFKYGGVFSKCRDLSRLTIKVPTLAVMATLAEALHAHPKLLVIRCKNRFDPSANTADAGGYRDFQTLCLYAHDGRHHFVEVQLNLIEMVAIKAGKGGGGGGGVDLGLATAGGHDAFNTARVIDAFSKRSVEYSGDPTDALWEMIASGALLRVDLSKATLTDAQAGQLDEAMASEQCRVKHLIMRECRGMTTIPGRLLPYIEAGTEGANALSLSEWTDLQTLPQSMAKLTKLKRLDISYCESLAEPLPDLSSLLPGGLKIETNDGTSGAANAWVDRGCIASTVDASLEMIAAGTFVADELSLAGSPMKAVPDSVGTLVQLKRLDVRWCANLEALPEMLFETLANLEELNLEWCDKLKTLPGSVAKLAKLKSLNLSNCRQLEALPETLFETLANLEELNLGSCKKLKTLPGSVAKLTKLKTLNLKDCDGLEALPETLFETMANLEELNLGSCGKLKSLPGSVAKLAKLKTLNLRYCTELEALPETLFEALANLEKLNLELCVKLKTLTGSVAKLAKLKSLNLGFCGELEALPETLFEALANLEKLNLEGCGKLKSLPGSVAKLAKLKTLNLRFCHELEALPETLFETLANLEELNLKSCDKLKTLPGSVAKLAKLKSLNLGFCDELEALPETLFETLANLEELHLESCGKLKTLPGSVAKLAKLKSLNLGFCDELEALPETLFETLANLEELNLESCFNLKTLPGSVAKLAKLKTLNLEDCDELAEPLPDLSSLNPVDDDGDGRSESDAASESQLKIKGCDFSKDGEAWAQRGFKAL